MTPEFKTASDIFDYSASLGLELTISERRLLRVLWIEADGDPTAALAVLDAWLTEAGL
jgi:hypothetical protein